MPRVTEKYRKARRDEIALAAIRCLERKGVHDTSIADIVEESGLSTGAIYSHFSSKVELARYIVAEYLFPRLDQLERSAGMITPRDVLTTMLAVFTDTGLPPRIVLQFWGEATIGGELREEMLRTVARLRSALGAALMPWAELQTSDAAAAEALVADAIRAVVPLAQGYVANTALFGPRDPREYVDSVVAALT
ncbi:MAG TPA: TetR/AcrR family transcriptional regulator [Microbacterium sp.]|uniref:TetR/AcrR family transcriptional regulator n=1 Tax=Microbacterium sp. TaxID=51671 RepID=UPI002BC8BDE2|nr:TetR/AcrR family transcriptional regulator [Microbacterium sp.]HWI31152.1 TetR/AcrR family transcriptional regulator [Microbacterium sp.]